MSGLDDQQYSEVWKLLISCILATDMALHFALVSQFETLIQNRPSQLSYEQKKLVANMLLKCADISNVVKPFPIAKNWAEILCNEFFLQGDIEKAKGLEISPLMDRASVIMPQMQLGFINSICFPLFNMLVSFIPDLVVLTNTLKDNITEWNRILKQGYANAKAKAEHAKAEHRQQ